MSFFQHKVTIVSDVTYGDCAKSKAVAHECNKGIYDVCCKFAGGANCGHTLIFEGITYKMNQIPSGIFFKDTEGKPMICIIGSDVVDLVKLEAELNKFDPKIRDQILISKYCHLIQEKHIEFDKANDLIGSTLSGNGPCLADKAYRTGQRVESKMDSEGKVLGCKVIDPKQFFREAKRSLSVIGEGSQGFYLDPDSDDYPYVTSASTLPTIICRLGLSYKTIVKVIGCDKGYTTYVGKREFQDMSDVTLARYQEEGKEEGTITKRKRKIGYFDINRTIVSCYAIGVDQLIISKSDVMMEVNKKTGDKFKILQDKEDGSVDDTGKPIREKIEFDTIDEFNAYIVEKLEAALPNLEVIFSYRADGTDLP